MEQRLIAASGAGDISTVRKLLRKNVPTGLKDEYAGHSEIVRILLEAGADINEKLGSNVTALHVAAKNNHATTVKYLILGGAQLDVKNYNSIPPIGLCQYGSDTWSVLRKASKGTVPDIDIESEVPKVPPHSLPVVSEEMKKSGKEKKKSRKGKKGKKIGKKTGKSKGKKK